MRQTGGGKVLQECTGRTLLYFHVEKANIVVSYYSPGVFFFGEGQNLVLEGVSTKLWANLGRTE